MQSDYALRYRVLYQRHWWWRARERWILRALSRWRPPGGWPSVLDVGCGDGLFFDQLVALGANVEGVERDASLVSPDGAHRQKITIAPFDERFQPGKRYSLILLLDVLEHMEDPVAALQHAVNLLEADGRVIATVPAFMILWTSHDVINRHFTRYTRRTFDELAQSAGLQVDVARYFFHWTFPVKLAAHFAQRASTQKVVVPAVPSRWLNGSLHALSVFEQCTLGRLRLPFGSSLLIVGQRASPLDSESKRKSVQQS